MKRILVWDLPTRIFHWLLVVAVIGAFVTQKIGGNAMIWHGRLGLLVLGLLVFRLVWGVVGSTYARFSQFIKGPAAIRSYVRGEWRGEGHNPLGALSVLALLGTLAALVSTGLFGNDDIAFEGPLYGLVGKSLSDRLVGFHRLLEPLILLLVAAHVAAIVFYVRVRKETLIMPMITGWKVGSGETAQGGGILPFLVASMLALAAVYAASGVWLPASLPPPAAPSSAPAW